MSESARITSVDAIVRFLAQLRGFRDAAENILLAHEQNVNRLDRAYAHDLPMYWKGEVRRRYDRLAEARGSLEACKMRKMKGERPSCFEEEKAFRRAKERLQTAQQKEDVVRHWRTQLQREIDECRGRLGRFRRVLDVDLEKTAGLLERILSSLEGYLGRPLLDDDETNRPEGAAGAPEPDAESTEERS